MRDPRERLLDILEAIALIERYAVRGRAAFEQDELLQTWIIHYLQIIGEAAARLGGGFDHAEIPWKAIVAMRNALVHEYFGLDNDEIWAVVEHDLPLLKTRIEALLGPPDQARG